MIKFQNEANNEESDKYLTELQKLIWSSKSKSKIIKSKSMTIHENNYADNNKAQVEIICFKSLEDIINSISHRTETVENQHRTSFKSYIETSKSVTNSDNHESMPTFILQNQTKKQSNNDTERFLLYLSAKEGKVQWVEEAIKKFILAKRSRYIKDNKMRLFLTLELKIQLKKKTLKFINLKEKRSGFNALHLAAYHGQTDVVKYLIINIGAKIDEKDEIDGNTPLILATKFQKKFVKRKSAVNEIEMTSRYGQTNTAITLIENDANLCIKNNNDSTALHYASRYGNAIIVSKILEKLTLVDVSLPKVNDVSAADNNGATPLHLAQIGGNELVVEDLIKYGAELFTDDKKNRGPIHYLAASKAYELKDIINKKDLLDILYDACKSIDDKTKLLNSKTIEKYTPMHFAVICGNEKCLNRLLSLGADVNSTDNKLMTPIHWACQFGKLPIVKILVENGASLDVKNKNDNTPFMCAHYKNHVNVVEYLNSRDEKINSSNANHLNHITPQLNPLNMLKKPSYTLCNSISLESLNNEHIDIGKIHEKSPLHFAAERGDLFKVKKHLTSINVNLPDEKGKTPLHLAALNNHGKVVTLLIESGADASFHDKYDLTPWDYAAQNDHALIVQILLENGAKVDFCFDVAVENKKLDSCMAIIEHKRWREVLLNAQSKIINNNLKEKESGDSHIMEKIIKIFPEVGLIVLDKCITYSHKNVNKKDPKYSITYDFEFLDSDPKNNQFNFFAPLTMVNFRQKKLLTHPLVVELINQKWSRMGIWMYSSFFFIYLLFVVLLTSFAVKSRISQLNEIDQQKNSTNNTSHITLCENVPMVHLYFLLSVIILIVLGKALLAFYIGKSYIYNSLKAPDKILDLFLYISLAFYIVPLVACKTNNQIIFIESMTSQAGSVSVLLAWCKCMIYMLNLSLLGIYLVMFMEVLYTLLKVLLMFSVLLIAFAFSFYILLDFKLAFNDYVHSLVKTFAMMLGELDYNYIFMSNSYNPNKSNNTPANGIVISRIVFLLFAFIMVVVVMNLLIGLAVGDIKSVRKNAFVRVLQRKVYYLNILNKIYPKFLQQYVYQEKYEKKPNEKKWYKKLMRWFPSLASLNEQGITKNVTQDLSSYKKAIMTLKKKVDQFDKISVDLEKQMERNKNSLQCSCVNKKKLL